MNLAIFNKNNNSTVDDQDDKSHDDVVNSLQLLKHQVQHKSLENYSESIYTSDVNAHIFAMLYGDATGHKPVDRLTELKQSISEFANSQSSSTIDNSTLSQIDFSALMQVPEFNKAMEGVAIENMAQVAMQFVKENATATNPNLVNKIDAINSSVAIKLSSVTSQNDVAQAKGDLDSLMDNIINEVMQFVEETANQISDQADNSANVAGVNVNNDLTDQVNKLGSGKNSKSMTSTPPPTLSATDEATNDSSDIVSTGFTSSAPTDPNTGLSYGVTGGYNVGNNSSNASQVYANLLNSSYNLSIIYLSVYLFLSLSESSTNILLADNQTLTINQTATDELNQAYSAFTSLNTISFPYEAGDGNTYNDLYSLMQYAYNPANSGNDDISNLQGKLSGLYTQLCDFDSTFEGLITGGTDSIYSTTTGGTTTNTPGSDSDDFTKIFTAYETHLNNDITSIDSAGLATFTPLSTSTVSVTPDGGVTTNHSVITLDSTNGTTQADLQSLTATIKTAVGQGSSIATQIQTQMQADAQQYMQTIEAAQSLVSNIGTINGRMWN